MATEYWWKYCWQKKVVLLKRKYCPTGMIFITNYTWSEPGPNLGLSCEKLASYCPLYERVIWIYIYFMKKQS
jgi:hypothetical protein